jgi:hypothetical protein
MVRGLTSSYDGARRGLCFLGLTLLIACSSGPTSPDASVSSEAIGAINLLFEGSCAWLRQCDSYSRRQPVGHVTFGCSGPGVCSDTAPWVAAPNRSYCGKTVRFCAGAKCTNALVKDVSSTHDWEGSVGVMTQLGFRYDSGTCRNGGYGGGHVTAQVLSANQVPPPEASANSGSDGTGRDTGSGGGGDSSGAGDSSSGDCSNDGASMPSGWHDDSLVGTTCGKDGDCNPCQDGSGLYCGFDGTCTPGCRSNAQCHGDDSCDTAAGQCGR